MVYETYKDECLAKNVKPIPVAAKLNSFLSSRLKAESQEFQDHIYASRRDAGAGAPANRIVKFAGNCEDLTEEDRL